MWRRTFLSDLLWSTEQGAIGTFRPSQYRAPSWSWASVEGPISPFSTSASWKNFGLDADLIRVGVKLEDAEAKTGAVTGGLALLQGRLLRVVDRVRSTQRNRVSSITAYPVGPSMDRLELSHVRISWDDSTTENEKELLLHPIQTGQDTPPRGLNLHICGLVLQEASVAAKGEIFPNLYCRLGRFDDCGSVNAQAFERIEKVQVPIV